MIYECYVYCQYIITSYDFLHLFCKVLLLVQMFATHLMCIIIALYVCKKEANFLALFLVDSAGTLPRVRLPQFVL